MKKLFYIIPVIILLITACTERIDIPLESSFTRLVVYGTLTSDTTTQYIRLTKTTSYYYNEAPPAVTGATVEISDDAGNSENLTEEEPGKYATSPQFAAIPGRIYTLRIDLPEKINGQSSYIATSSVSEIHSIDSIGLVYHADWGDKGVYEVTCYYQDPPSKDFYMFNIYKNGELLTDTITKRAVTDDNFFNGNYTNGIGVGYLNQSDPRSVLKPGDVVTFQGCSITEDYFKFVQTLQTETGYQNPLFSGPPANVKSNVSDGAVGFFAAYSVAYASKVFTP
jgi:hypothetical protein